MAKPWRISLVLWRVLKFFGISISVILVLFGVASWIVFENKNDWLLNQIQKYARESQSGQLGIASIRLKLFKNFPNITLELDSITYYEHADSVRTPDEQPILYADQLFVAVELLPLLEEELNVVEINLSNGQLDIVEYRNGDLNIELALADPAKSKTEVIRETLAKEKSPTPLPPPGKKEKKPPADSASLASPAPKATLQIDLEFISFNNIQLTWNSSRHRKPSVILLRELEADLSWNGNVLDSKLNSRINVEALYIKHRSIPKGELGLYANLHYEKDKQLLTLRQSDINYDIFSATIQGTYAHQKKGRLDLQVDASSNDLEILSTLIKPDVLKRNPNMLKQGDIYVKGRIYGELKNRAPQFNVAFGVKDLELALPKELGTFQDIGFEGNFNSGNRVDYSQAVVSIKKLKGQLPGGFLKGQFQLENFVAPYLKYDLDAELQLDGYDQLFKIDFLRQLSGKISLHANFDGPLKYFEQHRMDSSRSSLITLDNLSFVVAKTNQPVSGLSGKFENRNNTATFQQLAFTYGMNDFLLNASIENFVYFLFKQDRNLKILGNLRSNVCYTRDFIFDTLSTAQVQEKITNLSFDFKLNTVVDSVNSPDMPIILFDIRNLKSRFDELPDILLLDASGQFTKTTRGPRLDLREFRAELPHGKIAVKGDLFIPEKRLWQFNARLKMDKFPWTYVKELAAEIKDGVEPTAKNIPVGEMEIVTADVDLTAAVVTYPFDINKLEIRNSAIWFQYPGSKIFSVDNLNMALDKLYFNHPENSGSLTGLKSTQGLVELKQLKVPGLNTVDLKLALKGENDQLDIAFSRAERIAKSEKGQFLLDFSKKEMAYHLNFSAQEANLDYYIKKYYKKKLMEGAIDYDLDLRATGSSWTHIKQSLTGTIEIKGDSLNLYGMDIDDVLKKYEKSQNFNLTDLGAVLVAGPVGLAVTKGTNFVSLATIHLEPSQTSKIKTLFTRWKLENQQLMTEDVAIATHENRIAFNGTIDFAKDSIPGITIAVVDKKGCSLMDQQLYGKMGAMKTGKLNVTKTLLGSVINFANAVVGKDCKPVYTGRVKAPN